MKEFKGIPVIGKKLLLIRDGLVFSQEELALKIGMTKNNLSRLERAERIVGMHRESFRRLAELLRISLVELKDRIGAPAIIDDYDALILPEPMVEDIHERRGKMAVSEFIQKLLKKERKHRRMKVTLTQSKERSATNQSSPVRQTERSGESLKATAYR